MKNSLKSLLSEENIQVLVADDMSVIKGGTHGGCHNGGGHGKSGRGHGGSKSRGGSKGHGGWGGCVPPRPRPRPCPPRPC